MKFALHTQLNAVDKKECQQERQPSTKNRFWSISEHHKDHAGESAATAAFTNACLTMAALVGALLHEWLFFLNLANKLRDCCVVQWCCPRMRLHFGGLLDWTMLLFSLLPSWTCTFLFAVSFFWGRLPFHEEMLRGWLFTLPSSFHEETSSSLWGWLFTLMAVRNDILRDLCAFNWSVRLKFVWDKMAVETPLLTRNVSEQTVSTCEQDSSNQNQQWSHFGVPNQSCCSLQICSLDHSSAGPNGSRMLHCCAMPFPTDLRQMLAFASQVFQIDASCLGIGGMLAFEKQVFEMLASNTTFCWPTQLFADWEKSHLSCWTWTTDCSKLMEEEKAQCKKQRQQQHTKWIVITCPGWWRHRSRKNRSLSKNRVDCWKKSEQDTRSFAFRQEQQIATRTWCSVSVHRKIENVKIRGNVACTNRLWSLPEHHEDAESEKLRSPWLLFPCLLYTSPSPRD